MALSLPTDTAWLIPHVAAGADADPSTTAHCWVFALAPDTFTVSAQGAGEVRAEPRSVGHYGQQQVFTCLVDLPGLTPDTEYELSLRRVGVTIAVDRALVRTWPRALGGFNQPFRLFLGSCFSTKSLSRGGNQVGGLLSMLNKRGSIPHLKLLCGDQVYLDSPIVEQVPDSEPAIRELLLDKYLTNWGARTRDSSQFGSLLRTGSNILLTDDHEFWNNYPMPAVYAPRLAPALGGAQRAGWFAQAAHDLIGQFQCAPLFRQHRLGELTLVTMDGRQQRTATRAHPSQVLTQLELALSQAVGPVILALSQPLFEPGASHQPGKWWRRHVTDLTLADLSDYRQLVQLLADMRKDILVLSGDIHGGRVASVQSATHNIFEVVCSPLSLVAPALSYRDEFPSDEYPGLSGPHAKYSRIMGLLGPVTGNQGALLELSRLGDAIHVSVEFLESQSGKRLKQPGQSTFALRSLT